MMVHCMFGLLFGFFLHVVRASVSDTSCPVWFYLNDDTGQCECVSIHGMIECNMDQTSVMIASGVCITRSYSNYSLLYFVTRYLLRYRENNTNRMWSVLTSDPDDLNRAMCGYYKREGLFCPECIEGYGLPVYSEQKQCVNCSVISHPVRILLFLLIEILPVTLFFVCLVVFKFNMTSGPMMGYILFCQFYYETGIGYKSHIFDYIHSHTGPIMKYLFYTSRTLSELWNLQFFKSLIPPFCVSEQLTSAHVQMFNFFPSVYIIFLFIILCVLVELHTRNFKVVYYTWKPLSFILKCLKIKIKSNSIIHAFATCLFLSSTVIVYNMYVLNSSSTVFVNKNGQKKFVLWFSDPSTFFYSKIQVPYIGLAAIPFMLVVLAPALLLCIYPTRIYRKLCCCCSARKRLAVTAFVEALNHGFKDGLNSTRDFRMFTAFFILIIPTFICFSEFGSEIVLSLVFVLMCFIVSHARPCKSFLANLSLSYHFLMTGVLIIVFYLWENNLSIGTEILEVMIVVIPLISHVSVLTWMVRKVLKRYSGPIQRFYITKDK